MKLNILTATSQLSSSIGKSLGTGTMDGLLHLAESMAECKIRGDIYDLPNGSRSPNIASPFSLTNGFALNTDELNYKKIPELITNPSLLKHVDRISAQYNLFYQERRTVNYAIKRTLMPWILEECFHIFLDQKVNQRKKQFEEFKTISRYWLDDFALFQVFQDVGVDHFQKDLRKKDQPFVKEFIKQHAAEIEYYNYTQFICFEQRQILRNSMEKLGIGLIVNLPFGVELNSADVFFHSEVFDWEWQVGCSPEPEHGYPEQVWGIAAYKERSEGLKKYLEEKMKWISRLGDGVFFDHLVGWCGQYVLPMKITPGSVYPFGHFLTDDVKERKKNLHWFLEIALTSGLKIRGEVAGDSQRVKATNAVIQELVAKGQDISAMAIPRWETEETKLKPLKKYQESTLTMVETHDTSTLLQYLINQKGYESDFESQQRILEFCNRVLGLPFFSCDVPLTIESCREEFWFEICRRFTEGTPSRELVFTLPSLISILSSTYRSATVENNINIKPGTSGTVGNGWGNWSYFSPPVECMTSDPILKKSLLKLGNRKYKPFDYFHQFTGESQAPRNLQIIYSASANKEIIYRDSEGKWAVAGKSSLPAGIIELLIYNPTTQEAWEKIDVSRILALRPRLTYHFSDLNKNRVTYSYTAEELKDNLLFVRLVPGQIHHFLVHTTSPQL